MKNRKFRGKVKSNVKRFYDIDLRFKGNFCFAVIKRGITKVILFKIRSNNTKRTIDNGFAKHARVFLRFPVKLFVHVVYIPWPVENPFAVTGAPVDVIDRMVAVT